MKPEHEYERRVNRVIDHICYELYRGNPAVDARKGVFRCDLCLPVRPL